MIAVSASGAASALPNSRQVSTLAPFLVLQIELNLSLQTL